MSKIQNIDSHIIADVAERIERLITDARANVARAVNITEVITKYEIGRKPPVRHVLQFCSIS